MARIYKWRGTGAFHKRCANQLLIKSAAAALAPEEYPDSLSRGVLVGDAVYFVNGARVFAARWTDPFNQTGPH